MQASDWGGETWPPVGGLMNPSWLLNTMSLIKVHFPAHAELAWGLYTRFLKMPLEHALKLAFFHILIFASCPSAIVAWETVPAERSFLVRQSERDKCTRPPVHQPDTELNQSSQSYITHSLLTQNEAQSYILVNILVETFHFYLRPVIWFVLQWIQLRRLRLSNGL